MVSSGSNEGLLLVPELCSEPDERVEDAVLRRFENNCLSHDIEGDSERDGALVVLRGGGDTKTDIYNDT